MYSSRMACSWRLGGGYPSILLFAMAALTCARRRCISSGLITGCAPRERQNAPHRLNVEVVDLGRNVFGGEAVGGIVKNALHWNAGSLHAPLSAERIT